jgi:hypothetical protein
MKDIVLAKAYTTWIKNQIGTEPHLLVSSDPDYVEVQYTPEQRQLLFEWLDSQVANALSPRAPGDMRLNFGDVLLPWALRYMVPTVGAIFLAGYLTKGFRGWVGRS